MYNVMSKKAEEFIDHEEIEECLAYAEDNKTTRHVLTLFWKKQSK